jgi:hypothetical protein
MNEDEEEDEEADVEIENDNFRKMAVVPKGKEKNALKDISSEICCLMQRLTKAKTVFSPVLCNNFTVFWK